MEPIRRSRRLERRVADAQEEREARSESESTVTVNATPIPSAVPRAKRAKQSKKLVTTVPRTNNAATPATSTKLTTKDIDVVVKVEDGVKRGKTATAVGGSEETTSGKDNAIKTKRMVKPKAKTKGKANVDEDTAAVATGVEQEVKPKAKRGRKPKGDTATATAEATADPAMTAAATTKKAKKVKDEGIEVKNEDEDADVKLTSPGSAGRKKRKANQEESGDGDNGHGAETAGANSTQPELAPKRQRTAGKKIAPKATTDLAPAAETLTNKTDPYSALPTELWHEVMSYLALSHIAKASTVSKGWLEGTRALQIWRDACIKAELGKPAQKYSTHMSLVCSQSFWICEQCLKLDAGRGSDIPMPVEVEELGQERRMLCRECRCKYYEKHPEKVETRRRKRRNAYDEYVYEHMRLTKTDACDMYCLKDEDLLGLPCLQRINPHYRNAPPMRLYEEEKVINRALSVHGGYIGLKAARTFVAKTRREAFKKRSQNSQTRVVLKSGKMPKNHQFQEQGIQGILQKLAENPEELERAVAFYVEENAPKWLMALSIDSSRARIKEAITEAEARVAADEPILVIKSTTRENMWIDNIRNSINENMVKRAGLKRIIENFEAGVYDKKTDVSTAAASESASDMGSSPTGTVEPAGGLESLTQSAAALDTIAVAVNQ
ncbi:hypothetical protein EC991_005229 [Linnemannia zychae]|nr:hypothetical protein EC991_005229 [Linnemannia zychae]